MKAVKFWASVAAILGTGLGAATQAGEGASGVGRGETFLTLADDTVIVADAYFDGRLDAMLELASMEGEPFDQDIPKLVVMELERIERLLPRYAVSFIRRNFMASFVYPVKPSPKGPAPRYRLVKKLPDGCDKMPLQNIPEGAIAHVKMCTPRFVTYIQSDLLKMKVSVREWAKALIHERLHAFAQTAAHDFITPIVSGIGVALEIYDSQLKGNRPILDAPQIQALKNMMAALAILGISVANRSEWNDSPYTQHGDPIVAVQTFWEQFSITARGGGLVSRAATVDPQAYFGIGTRIGPKSVIGQAEVLDAWIEGKVGDRSVIVASQFPNSNGKAAPIDAGTNVHIERSKITGRQIHYGRDFQTIRFAADSSVLDSQIDGGAALGERARVVSSQTMDVDLSADTAVLKAKTPQVAYRLAPGARVEDAILGPFILDKETFTYIWNEHYRPSPLFLQLGEQAELRRWRETAGVVAMRSQVGLLIFPFWLNDSRPELKVDAGLILDLANTPLCAEMEGKPAGLRIIRPLHVDKKHSSREKLRKLLCQPMPERKEKA